MIILLNKRPLSDEISKAKEDFGDYLKVDVDVEKETMTIGGQRHFEGEKLLLGNGSAQENIWGGGVDLKTGEIDYNSIINIRPKQNNPSRDILSAEIRQKFAAIIKELLLA